MTTLKFMCKDHKDRFYRLTEEKQIYKGLGEDLACSLATQIRQIPPDY